MLFSCCTNFLPCDNKSLPYFCVDFYLRPPRGGQPLHRGGESRNGGISIHALREEGDRTRPTRASSGWNFYPRPPRGGRRDFYVQGVDLTEFLSTPSARRATQPGLSNIRNIFYFYPRPPRGGRHAQKSPSFCHRLFLSTPSARRATS